MKEYNQNDIERYIRKQMNASEQQAFRGEMNADEGLQEEVNFYEDVAATIRKRRVLADVRAELKADNFFSEKASTSTTERDAKVVSMPARGFGRVRSLLAYAASVLMLVVAGSTWWANTNYSNKGLASLDYDTIVSGDVRGGENQDVFEQGLQAIEAKDYVQAKTFFKDVPRTSESYTEAALYLAYVEYETANYSAAIQAAEQVLANNPTASNRFSADWLIVQAQLASGDTDSSFQQNLAAIADNDNHDFQVEAQALQTKVNSFWRRFVF